MKKNVDYATILGLFGAITMVGWVISMSHTVHIYLNLPSFLLVVVGSAFIVLIKFNVYQFAKAMGIAFRAFFVPTDTLRELIDVIMTLHKKARIHGLLALEDEPIEHPFLRQGIKYVVDNISPGIIKNTLHKEISHTFERHQSGARVFRALAEVSPAMGMVGTLIGLVQMMAGMDDPKGIGPAMAVALLTTLYGALMAYVIASPIADKLQLRSQEEYMLQLLIADGVLGIQQALHPYVLEEILLTYLPGSQRSGGRWKAREVRYSSLSAIPVVYPEEKKHSEPSPLAPFIHPEEPRP
ncbi:MAG: MotA/TolQ/ExbB proton channel family protein [Desulfobulbaceae bacterium]|nr:MotA/TolQ/ExbB proton channel family protein [Desulfobulbaceae bacterium]HIJ89528.1 flagellar motor protein PomA [Deltaproteobacteria bacterium]